MEAAEAEGCVEGVDPLSRQTQHGPQLLSAIEDESIQRLKGVSMLGAVAGRVDENPIRLKRQKAGAFSHQP